MRKLILFTLLAVVGVISNNNKAYAQPKKTVIITGDTTKFFSYGTNGNTVEFGNSDTSRAAVRMPRVAHPDSIRSPTKGMLVFCTTDSSLYIRRNFTWLKLGATAVTKTYGGGITDSSNKVMLGSGDFFNDTYIFGRNTNRFYLWSYTDGNNYTALKVGEGANYTSRFETTTAGGLHYAGTGTSGAYMLSVASVGHQSSIYLYKGNTLINNTDSTNMIGAGLTNSPVTDTATNKPVVITASGRIQKMAYWPGGGGTTTASNGLTLNSGNIKLGGDLTENTEIAGDGDYGISFHNIDSLKIGLPSAANGKILSSNADGYATWANIKTVNGNGLLGSGDITIGGADSTTFETNFGTDTLRKRIDSTLARKANQETHLGVIYNKSSWTSGDLAADFTQSGGITASVVSNKIQVSGGSGTYTQLLKLNGGTYLEHWQMSMKVKLGTITGTSYGFGIGVVSSNTYVPTTSSIVRWPFAASTGVINFASNTSGSFANIFTTTKTVSQSDNDYILLTYKMDFPNVYMSVRNMTTGAAAVDTLAFGYGGGNTGNFTIYSFGGTFTIDSLAVTSTEIKYASDLFIGDSKMQGGYLPNPNNRMTSILSQYSRSIVNVGAGGDRTTDILDRLPQILSLKPKRVFLAIGSNDTRSGVSSATLQANYASIANQLKAGGAAVYHLLPFYETSISQTTQRAWLLSTFSADSIIDTYTPMTVAGRLDPDNVHPNTIANAALATTILESGKMTDIKYLPNYRYGAISRSRDSVFQEVNGTPKFFYKDSIGAGSTPSLNTVMGVGNTTSSLAQFTGASNIPASGSGLELYYLSGSGRIGAYNRSSFTVLPMQAASPFTFFQGTAAAGMAPVKFQSGTNLTTPEAGAMEFDGTNLSITASTTRYTLAKTLTATATLDFPSTATGVASDLTITVTGAALGDAVSIGVPNGSITATGMYYGWVSATNTVTIRYLTHATEDPASGTFRASVLKY